MTKQAIKEGRIPEEWQARPARLRQKDRDARWAKKGEETYYGYKDHVVCDLKSKLITEYAVTHAAIHDSCVMEELLSSGVADGQKLYADSAYRSAEIEESSPNAA